MAKLLCNRSAPDLARAPWSNKPTTDLIWFRIKQIHERPRPRHFHESIELPDLIERVNARRQPAVYAENFPTYNYRQRKVVKKITAHLPHVRIAELPQAFVVEAEHLGCLSGFVRASQERDSVLVPHLQCNEQTQRFNARVAAINVVTQEDIVSVRRFASE